MNDCSKTKCPFNASTFKDCNMTCECDFYTKKLTNGDVIKAMFPNIVVQQHHATDLVDEYVQVTISDTSNYYSLDWWNAPYRGE